jgi:hypothetical protein
MGMVSFILDTMRSLLTHICRKDFPFSIGELAGLESIRGSLPWCSSEYGQKFYRDTRVFPLLDLATSFPHYQA